MDNVLAHCADTAYNALRRAIRFFKLRVVEGIEQLLQSFDQRILVSLLAEFVSKFFFDMAKYCLEFFDGERSSQVANLLVVRRTLVNISGQVWRTGMARTVKSLHSAPLSAISPQAGNTKVCYWEEVQGDWKGDYREECGRSSEFGIDDADRSSNERTPDD